MQLCPSASRTRQTTFSSRIPHSDQRRGFGGRSSSSMFAVAEGSPEVLVVIVHLRFPPHGRSGASLRLLHAWQIRARPMELVDDSLGVSDALHANAAPVLVNARELAVATGGKTCAATGFRGRRSLRSWKKRSKSTGRIAASTPAFCACLVASGVGIVSASSVSAARVGRAQLFFHVWY